MAGPSLNRIDIIVPGNAFGYAQVQRDEAISKLTTTIGLAGDLYHYVDYTSGWGGWGYYFYGFRIDTSGTVTIGTVTCEGATNPPSGSGVVAIADPGPGNYTWGAMGTPNILRTSGDRGGGSIPQGNNNYYVWPVASNSPTAAADFTTAVTVVEAALASSLLGGAIQKKYLKYVDSVSGAWQVSAIYFGAGCAEFGSTSNVSVLPNNNILYVVTCAGTPHPPTGSPLPSVTIPAFTQTFTLIGSPFRFGPQR